MSKANHHLWRASAALAASLLMAGSATAQGKPDLLGVWLGAGFGGGPFRNTEWAPAPSFTAWGAAESKRLDDPQTSTGYCTPGAPPGLMSANPLFPMQIASSPGELIVFMEGSPIQRHIYLDGRAHPKDLEPTWFGHSVGRWEDDVLVVDTVGIKASSRPLNGFVSGAVSPLPSDLGPRLPLSDQLHMVERIRLVGGGEYLEDEITIDDAKTYTRPFSWKVYSQRRPDLALQEYYCAENLRPEDEGYTATQAAGSR